MSAHNYHPQCGCFDCCNVEADDERRDEEVESLLADKGWRDANLRTAEEWVAGTFDGDHYTEVTLALDALHREGLTASVLLRLHQLAKVESLAMDVALKDVAETEVDGRRKAA